MADIKQAAKWMQEGKHVFDPIGFELLSDGEQVLFAQTREPFELTVADALSDDWEIAE